MFIPRIPDCTRFFPFCGTHGGPSLSTFFRPFSRSRLRRRLLAVGGRLRDLVLPVEGLERERRQEGEVESAGETRRLLEVGHVLEAL